MKRSVSHSIFRTVDLTINDIKKTNDGSDQQSFLDPALLATQSEDVIHSRLDSDILLNAPLYPVFQQKERKTTNESAIDHLISKDGLLSRRAQNSGRSSSFFGLSGKETTSSSAPTSSFGLPIHSHSSDDFTDLTQPLSASQVQNAAQSTKPANNSFSRKAVLSTNVSSEDRDRTIKDLWTKIKPHMDIQTQKAFSTVICRAKSVGAPSTLSQVSNYPLI
jgi:hypothetical protein